MGPRLHELRFRFQARYRVVWFALAALLIVAALTEGATFHGPSVNLITALAGVLAIAAAGQLLVVMSGGIDLSVPAVMALGGAVVVKQTQGADDELALALVEAIGLAAAIGLVNGLLVAVARLNALIVTLAMNGIVAGAILWWTQGTFSTSGEVPPALADFTAGGIGSVNVLGLVGLALLIVLGLVIRCTAPGRSFVAMGTNRAAAEIVGVRVRAYEVAGYVIAAVLYVSAGILLAGMIEIPNTTIGDPYLLSTIVAVALGGAALSGGPSSMVCTAAGCLFLAILDQYLTLRDFGAGIQDLANGIALAAAVAIVTLGSGGGRRLRAILGK